ncbi:MAG: hypothetical protein ACYC5J_15410 [Chloroflexota bacterium]
MQCAATVKGTKRRCRQMALPGGDYCWVHARAEAGRRGEQGAERSFYSDALDEVELGLEVATALRGVGDEIAVLRVLIRKVAREGDLEATRRGIETLCRALKVQYALEGRSAEGLAGSVARVLDEVGNELGMAL